MRNALIDVVTAGHICLDIIPRLSREQRRAEDLFIPGGLVSVGPATLAMGGCVANTGLALHRLGAKTRFVGKIGDDLLGKTILESLRQYDEAFPESMVIAAGEATSYTIVLSPPQVDRGFLHCPGANDTFVAADLDVSAWQDARILHFGYPPLMRRIAADEGHGLAGKFAEVRRPERWYHSIWRCVRRARRSVQRIGNYGCGGSSPTSICSCRVLMKLR